METLLPDVVVDVAPDATRLGAPGGPVATGPPLDLDLDGWRRDGDCRAWAAATADALAELASGVGLELANTRVLFTEHVAQRFGPGVQRARWAKVAFDRLDAGAVALRARHELALAAGGGCDGFVVDATHVVPLLDGRILPHGIKVIDCKPAPRESDADDPPAERLPGVEGAMIESARAIGDGVAAHLLEHARVFGRSKLLGGDRAPELFPEHPHALGNFLGDDAAYLGGVSARGVAWLDRAEFERRGEAAIRAADEG